MAVLPASWLRWFGTRRRMTSAHTSRCTDSSMSCIDKNTRIFRRDSFCVGVRPQLLPGTAREDCARNVRICAGASNKSTVLGQPPHKAPPLSAKSQSSSHKSGPLPPQDAPPQPLPGEPNKPIGSFDSVPGILSCCCGEGWGHGRGGWS